MLLSNIPKSPPKEDDFLASPHNLEKYGYFILCIECRKPLWKQRILSHNEGRPMSTETLPCSKEIEKFATDIEWCGYCGKKFYAIGKKGTHLYLIKDGKSGITRLT
jgi:hypothetical protein